MGSLAEAWAKQKAYYDRMALIEKAKYQRARADKAEAALAEWRLVAPWLREHEACDIAYFAHDGGYLRCHAHDDDLALSALAKWEASRAK